MASLNGTADGQAGHGILEHLLEAQELDHGQVNVGLETQTALVGAQSGIVLHAVAAVDMPDMVVIFPGNAELNNAIRLDHALQQSGLLVLGMSIDDGGQRGQDLFDSLQELGLGSVLGLGLGENALNVLVHWTFPPKNIFGENKLRTGA